MSVIVNENVPDASLFVPGSENLIADVLVIGGGSAALCAAITANGLRRYRS